MLLSDSIDIRGMPVFGGMVAVLAANNQLISHENLVRFEIVPSQDASREPLSKFRVKAPEGFVIRKRCPKLNKKKYISDAKHYDKNRFKIHDFQRNFVQNRI